MTIREAASQDIPAMHVVRISVKENVLSNPALVTPKEYADYILHFGKGWVCEYEKQIIGFAIVGLQQRNVWALFVHPEFEKMGIGKQLQATMLDWYFSQTQETVWLSTAPNSRAEAFYRQTGWAEAGTVANGEIKFEMTFAAWQNSSL
ncbi:GNAT family N-acetyltransferase [Rufibacter sp. LB8]|uniref:GNAT family N-acetyltransferase n=1 Tax=Rufibacter sp. LB8 TaxID=2777781 RepID=UPI00178C501B|nr:GNAT family N-acetyltransferase [Rufibacter sp. LB8]